MAEKCTICGRELGEAYRCPACGFDRRGDFVGRRTLRPAGNREIFEYLMCCEWAETAQQGKKKKDTVFSVQMNGPSNGPSVETIDPDKFQVSDGVLIKYNGKDKVVDIPDGITAIGHNAFEGCDWITRITIPRTGVFIGSYAFADCTSLSEISLPENLLAISDGAFFNCITLKNVKIPMGMRKIEFNTFAGCKSLTNIVIPKNVEKIRERAFHFCTGLTYVRIEEGVRIIDHFAFQRCDMLQTVILPKSIEKISPTSFGYGDRLNDFIVPPGTKDRIGKMLGIGMRKKVKERREVE